MTPRAAGRAALLAVAILLAACGSDQIGLVDGDSAAGEGLFGSMCAGCHGPSAEGADNGPPLDHSLYLVPEYGDAELARAIRDGAPQAHWNFGAMPGFRSLSDREISDIVAYVRVLQAR